MEEQLSDICYPSVSMLISVLIFIASGFLTFLHFVFLTIYIILTVLYFEDFNRPKSD